MSDRPVNRVGDKQLHSHAPSSSLRPPGAAVQTTHLGSDPLQDSQQNSGNDCVTPLRCDPLVAGSRGRAKLKERSSSDAKSLADGKSPSGSSARKEQKTGLQKYTIPKLSKSKATTSSSAQMTSLVSMKPRPRVQSGDFVTRKQSLLRSRRARHSCSSLADLKERSNSRRLQRPVREKLPPHGSLDRENCAGNSPVPLLSSARLKKLTSTLSHDSLDGESSSSNSPLPLFNSAQLKVLASTLLSRDSSLDRDDGSSRGPVPLLNSAQLQELASTVSPYGSVDGESNTSRSPVPLFSEAQLEVLASTLLPSEGESGPVTSFSSARLEELTSTALPLHESFDGERTTNRSVPFNPTQLKQLASTQLHHDLSNRDNFPVTSAELKERRNTEPSSGPSASGDINLPVNSAQRESMPLSSREERSHRSDVPDHQDVSTAELCSHDERNPIATRGTIEGVSRITSSLNVEQKQSNNTTPVDLNERSYSNETNNVQPNPKPIIRRVLDSYFDRGAITNRQYKRILERASRRVQERLDVSSQASIKKLVMDYVKAYRTHVPYDNAS